MRAIRTTTRRESPAGPRPGRAGFTLMEMMVVIGLVALLATMTLPSVIALYNSGADSQAYNLIAAQLTAARALAIEKGTFAGVHCQAADATNSGQPSTDPDKLLRPDLQHVCFTALVLYDPDKRHFRLHEGSRPQRVPGSIAYGKVCSETVEDSGSYKGQAADIDKFTTFTVVFTPSGSATATVNGQKVKFREKEAVFDHPTSGGRNVDSRNIAGKQLLWNFTTANDQYPVTAITLFDLGDYYDPKTRKLQGDRLRDKPPQILPLNSHTGQLFPRE